MKRRALISVFDKSGVVPLAEFLVKNDWEIISTGGTSKVLLGAQIPIITIEEVTEFPEMLGGRVKTLHPKIHGGLLYLRGTPEHIETIQKYNICPIDMVVVNLYPFEQTIQKPNVTLYEAVEQIDIGGPSMLRSGAKNFPAVTVLCDPKDYAPVMTEMEQNVGSTTLDTRKRLAGKAFRHTGAYDTVIANYFEEKVVGGKV